MKVLAIDLKNYRNIADCTVEPCSGVNVIYGDNAQGKTNLIEALWLFSPRRLSKNSAQWCFHPSILT